LESILSFYDRFAAQNATNPRLQGEAAWAYRKVGALYEKLGRETDAEAAYAKAIAMFEDLVARYPGERRYSYRLVQTYDMSDPLSAAPDSLEPMVQRLDRARTIGDRLAAEAPNNPDYVQSQIRVQIKLGRVLTRLKRNDEARECYLRVIPLIDAQVDAERAPEDRLLDRATVREALALLELGRGRSNEARTILDAAAADLQDISAYQHIPPPLAGRLSSVAQAYEKLGDRDRARELRRRAGLLRGRPDDGPPGRGPGPGRSRVFDGTY
jgi:tetratricopeptide (TPR) repeat protein